MRRWQHTLFVSAHRAGLRNADVKQLGMDPVKDRILEMKLEHWAS